MTPENPLCITRAGFAFGGIVGVAPAAGVAAAVGVAVDPEGGVPPPPPPEHDASAVPVSTTNDAAIIREILIVRLPGGSSAEGSLEG
jgi:hypothetical protein